MFATAVTIDATALQDYCRKLENSLSFNNILSKI